MHVRSMLTAVCGQALLASALLAQQGAALELIPLGQNLSAQQITAMSADGATVAGWVRGAATGPTFRTFTYRLGNGGLQFQDVGTPKDLPGGASQNGAAIAIAPLIEPGRTQSAGVINTQTRAIIFRVAGLGNAQTSANESVRVMGLSDDASRVLGSRVRLVNVPGGALTSRTTWLYDQGDAALRELSWTVPAAGGGTVEYTQSRPIGMSADGSRVLVAVEPALSGAMQNALIDYAAGVWSAPGSFQPMQEGTPNAISGDGRTVVGRAERVGVAGRFVPALWQDDLPMVRLALPPNALGGQFFAVAAEGEAAVGTYTTAAAGTRPLMWIKARGTRDLSAILARHGVGLPAGVQLRSALRISADGSMVTGFATGPNNQLFLYHATIPEVELFYANCDGSLDQPVLTLQDFSCFINRLTIGAYSADCTRDGEWDAMDMVCFLNRYQAGR